MSSSAKSILEGTLVLYGTPSVIESRAVWADRQIKALKAWLTLQFGPDCGLPSNMKSMAATKLNELMNPSSDAIWRRPLTPIESSDLYHRLSVRFYKQVESDVRSQCLNKTRAERVSKSKRRQAERCTTTLQNKAARSRGGKQYLMHVVKHSHDGRPLANRATYPVSVPVAKLYSLEFLQSEIRKVPQFFLDASGQPLTILIKQTGVPGVRWIARDEDLEVSYDSGFRNRAAHIANLIVICIATELTSDENYGAIAAQIEACYAVEKTFDLPLRAPRKLLPPIHDPQNMQTFSQAKEDEMQVDLIDL